MCWALHHLKRLQTIQRMLAEFIGRKGSVNAENVLRQALDRFLVQKQLERNALLNTFGCLRNSGSTGLHEA